MRCFYQSDPTRREYRKQMITIWREIGTFDITELRLTDQAKINELLTKGELEENRRKILTTRHGEENQEINDNPVIQERIKNKNGAMESSETEICIK